MADVTGPISSLPGSYHPVPAGATCDTEGHDGRPAVLRVQGETDSFGSEMCDMCQECVDAYKAEIEADRSILKYCSWCKKLAKDVRPFRDYDEGLTGPVYQVCGACRRKELDYLHGR